MKSLCSVVILSLLALAAGSVAYGQDEDPFAGTWKLNVEKSKLARPVRSATMKLRVALDPDGFALSMEKMDLERVYADGARETRYYAARYSGNDFGIFDGVGGAPIGEEAKLKVIDANTREFARLRNRKPLASSRRVLSADHKTLTVTTTAPDGTVQDVEIWERQ
jgi:hypothetical protein